MLHFDFLVMPLIETNIRRMVTQINGFLAIDKSKINENETRLGKYVPSRNLERLEALQKMVE